MKNLRLVWITLLIVLMTLALPGAVALADGGEGQVTRFTDTEELLTAEEARLLTAKLDEISLRWQFDVVIAVKYSLDNYDARVDAADFYEAGGFGFGDDRRGIILMLAMRDRDWAFATTGYGEHAFTYSGQEYLERLFLPYLKNDDFYTAFMTFADAVDDFLEKADAGNRYMGDNIPSMTPIERRNAHIQMAIASLVIALIIPGIVVAVWTRQLKSVRPQDHASNYIRNGSLLLRRQQDIFLYRNVSRVSRAQSSGGSGGGLSGGFSSSSGRSFSGRSGKF